MPIAWAELPAPVQQLVYDGLGVMGVLALNREWRAALAAEARKVDMVLDLLVRLYHVHTQTRSE